MNKFLTLFFCCLAYSAFAGAPVNSPTTGDYCIPNAELAPIRGGGSSQRVLSNRNLKGRITRGANGNTQTVSAFLSCNHCQGLICTPWTFQITDTIEVMQIIR
jgi:hypothetical protein